MAEVVELKKDEAEFSLGDVVTLKSDKDVGMTVKTVAKNKVTVEWMNGNNDLNTADFHPKQLRLKADSDGG